MYTKILVPLDGSKRAEKILPYVEKLAISFNSSVVFLQVVETYFPYASSYNMYSDPGVSQSIRDEILKEAEGYLISLQTKFLEMGIQANYKVTEGPVVRIIIEIAESEGADLIAMTSHGRTGLARVFYGNVAAGVLHLVDRPLLLIRSEGDE